MKRLFAAVALLAGAAGCGYVVGDGNVTTEVRELPAFDQVENTTQLKVIVHAGSGDDTLAIDSNLHEYVRTEVVGGVLKVDVTRWIVPAGTAELAVFTTELTRLFSSGSGETVAAVFGPVPELTLVSTGSGPVFYEGRPARLLVTSTGSGSVEALMSGDFVADLVRIQASGSGPVETVGVPGVDLDIGCSGSGSVESTIAGGDLKIVLTGSGNVKWHGTASTQDFNDTGSGDILHVD